MAVDTNHVDKERRGGLCTDEAIRNKPFWYIKGDSDG